MNIKILYNLKGIVTPRSKLGYGLLDILNNMSISINDKQIADIDTFDNLIAKYPGATY